jgi:hypothetical protein
MRKLPLVSLMLAFSLVAARAAACDTIETARLDSDCIVMPYGGQPGVWFRLDKAEGLRQASLSITPLTARAEAAEALATLQAGRAEDLARASTLLRDALQAKDAQIDWFRADSQAARAAEAQTKAEADKRWSAGTWFGLGAGAAGIVGAGLYLAAQALQHRL